MGKKKKKKKKKKLHTEPVCILIIKAQLAASSQQLSRERDRVAHLL
jgi:hypothetical protein